MSICVRPNLILQILIMRFSSISMQKGRYSKNAAFKRLPFLIVILIMLSLRMHCFWRPEYQKHLFTRLICRAPALPFQNIRHLL